MNDASIKYRRIKHESGSSFRHTPLTTLDYYATGRYRAEQRVANPRFLYLAFHRNTMIREGVGPSTFTHHSALLFLIVFFNKTPYNGLCATRSAIVLIVGFLRHHSLSLNAFCRELCRAGKRDLIWQSVRTFVGRTIKTSIILFREKHVSYRKHLSFKMPSCRFRLTGTDVSILDYHPRLSIRMVSSDTPRYVASYLCTRVPK